MKNKLDNELVLQISIILACLVIIFFRFSTMPTHAQTFCDNQPQLLDPLTPLKRAWIKGKTVSVEVFDTPHPTDFNMISNGIRFWNAQLVENCPYVAFNEATQANRPYNENETLPSDTIWVIRPQGQGSQLFPEFRDRGTSQQSLRAARMVILSTITHNSSGTNALDVVAAHETGHSLGLANEVWHFEYCPRVR